METPGERLARLEEEARSAIDAAADLQSLTETRARFLGRKGSLSELLRGIGELAPAQRAELGQALNACKERVEAVFAARRDALESARQAESLRAHALDVTLPGQAPERGHLHPVTLIQREMVAFFTGLGFSVEEGPDVETDWNNFGALNIPEDHPSRDLHDTFFVTGNHVLRTHTSPVQIRAMSGRTPPFRFISPGRVYRRDSDATHHPLFHQIEGVLVDEGVTFADLKGVLHAFARFLIGPETRLRFRAHYFPFTEPSAEMDFSWRGGWLEWGGCGMIHPRVLGNVGIDAARYQGFAFGMGIDRAAMQRFGIANIHTLFDADQRVLEQV
jgi:phenylalanyl-tRNA synthetase alpha chain